jgi:hypothetical protein
MKADFKLEGHHRPVVVLEPETPHERLLLAAFIRHDANALSLSVERFQNGQIERLTLYADEAR